MSVESAESEGPGNRCSKLLTPWIAGARDHELQDPPAAAQAAGFAAEATDDLPALSVPEVAGAAGIGCQREPRMVG